MKIRNIVHKGMRRLIQDIDAAGLPAQFAPKIVRVLLDSIAAVLPLPFEPAIWSVGRPRCGSPSAASSASIGARSARAEKSPLRSKSGSVSSHRRDAS